VRLAKRTGNGSPGDTAKDATTMNDIAADRTRGGALPEGLLAQFVDIVGAEHALTDPDQQLPYLREWRDLYQGVTPVVLRPADAEQVARIVRLAAAHHVPIVPQSGNTGLVGGQIPHRGEILLSLARLTRVRAVDPVGNSMTVEAGVTLADCQAAAERAGRLFPLSLPSEGSCRIGGNLSTNAGGVGVLAYGNTRQLVLGLEVVLADGRVWNGLKALKKDNTGYDLKDLFVGSEGTLGIITAAVLKLFPRPAEKVTALVALPEIDATLELLALAQARAGTSLTAFEFMPRFCLEMVIANVAGARDAFPTAHPWYVLLEISGLNPDGAAAANMERLLEEASERGYLLDAVIAGSLQQSRDLWRLREAVSEAQKGLGGTIKHDISVPVAQVPEFIRRADAIVEDICPGARPFGLGHLGDGNVHYNVAQPIGMDKAAFLALWDPMMEAVHGLVVEMNGSISAEHGIGWMKRHELAHFKQPVELDLMRRIKAAFDPDGIFNPGKVVG
jgi:FAD/FMN-containing dehydrogenase